MKEFEFHERKKGSIFSYKQLILEALKKKKSIGKLFESVIEMSEKDTST